MPRWWPGKWPLRPSALERPRIAVLRFVRALWRLGRCGLHALYGAVLCAAVLPFLTPARRMQRVSRWSQRMLAVLGVRLHAEGQPHAGPLLVVANHVSWLDILVINAVHPARFISKSEVRRWPLIGWFATSSGTLFIERARRRDALRVVHQVAEALRAGDTVALFPEGTTSRGHSVLPFHANLLQAAIAAQAPVQALTLRYSDAHHPVSVAAAYVDNISLLASLWAVLRADRLCARVQIDHAQGTRHLDRRALAERLREAMASRLSLA